jgi:DNA mismatch repair protein MutS
MAYADITTGEFAATQFASENAVQLLFEEVSRLGPAEVIAPGPRRRNSAQDWASSAEALERLPALGGIGMPFAVTELEYWPFELETASQALLDHFGVKSLDGFGMAGRPFAVRAAGGLLHYLAETQRGRLAQLSSLQTYTTDGFMMLDVATRRNLELTETLRRGEVEGSLLGVLDLTVTSMGARRLRQWLNQPLLQLDPLNERLDTVEAFYEDTPVRTKLRGLLKEVSDLERLGSRVVQGIARPRELLGIRLSLEVLPQIQEAAAGIGGGAGATTEFLSDLNSLEPCADVASLIGQALTDEPPSQRPTPGGVGAGGVIREGFSAELDNIVAASRDAKEWVANLEKREQSRTGIKNLKVGYNKVFGYYLEVTKANLDRVPGDYVRKQTLVNAERYITPELKEYEALILNAEERIQELEARIYQQILEQVGAAAGRLRDVAHVLADLDVYTALAEVALMHRYVRPTLLDSDELHIVAGRHPVVEVTQRQEPFVPNDVSFDSDSKDEASGGRGAILLITGPNMAGKSTFLRQVALIVLMAQIGSFVPADQARIGLVDRIYTRIGAQDEISAGQSTFMVEMVETANLLNHATPRSLLVLDEIGRGTSTYDGISIAWAVVEYIHNHPKLCCRTLFATHYHELTQLADLLPRIRNLNVAVAEEKGNVVFLRRVLPGAADRSYGIHVAQLAGLPKPVIHRAEEILEELEREARAPGSNSGTMREDTPWVRQLPLFATSSPILDDLRRLELDAMTPLEAISKLYELQKKAKEG